jgi:hypothetical protein
VKGYWEKGQWRAAVPYGQPETDPSGVSEAVTQAVEEANAGRDPGELLRLLFDKYPHLRSDRWDNSDEPHPLSPLVTVFVKRRLA